MRIHEKEIWKKGGLAVRCGTTGVKENDEEVHSFFEFEDLGSTELSCNVSYYDPMSSHPLVKKMNVRFQGESELFAFMEAFEYVSNRFRKAVKQEERHSENLLRAELSNALFNLKEIAEASSDWTENRRSVTWKEPLSLEELEEAVKIMSESGVDLIPREDINSDWPVMSSYLSSADRDALSFVCRMFPRLMSMVFRQAVIIQALKEAPLESLLEENKILREWFEDSEDGNRPLSQMMKVDERPVQQELPLVLPEAKKSSVVKPDAFVSENVPEVVVEKPFKMEGSNYRDIVMKVLPEHSGYPFRGMTAEDVAEESKWGVSSLASTMSKMAKEGLICCWRGSASGVGNMVYSLPRKLTIRDAVVEFLSANFGDKFPPSVIALAIGKRKSSVASSLSKMFYEEVVDRHEYPGMDEGVYFVNEKQRVRV